MDISIAEARAFVADAEKSREQWLIMAKRSWDELKKRQANGRLWSVTPNSAKKRARYPAWYSIFKIRQPLLLSRIGIPVGRDVTQDGNDPLGATAAICKERLATNLARGFDFFDVLCSARDDALATNFGQVRAYYERDEVKEPVKQRITYQQIPNSEEGVFVDEQGKVVESDDIGQDDDGYFLETDQVVDVDNERICMEHVLFCDFFADPNARRYRRFKRMAFAEHYSEPEFIKIFGQEAFLALPKEDETSTSSDPKKRLIKVYEYWDFHEKEVRWFADNGPDFITPKGYYLPDDAEEEEEQRNGLYDLEKFFPCPEPLTFNQPTDEFWPVPEYSQLTEIIDDIHGIFSRMFAITRAIRSRLLFDNSIQGLQEALNEAAEGDAFGVTNLAQLLSKHGGTLDGVVQYIPVKQMIEGLNQMYTALEQRLMALYRLTGTSDLLQGQTDTVERTYGEQQMKERYALNQIAEPQRKMQEFVRNCYELMCEMALKNFKDESLDRYIMPRTLQPEQQAQYRPAIELLKNDLKRFRIELETDSTIALNEEYDKQMRIELVNALTGAIEKTASTAISSPALVKIELHALKYLIQGFRQGKLFQQEITQAIDNVIKQAEQQPAPFNKEQADFQLKQQQMQMQGQMDAGKLQLESYKAQQETAYKQGDLSLRARRDQLLGQLAVLDYQLEAQKAGVEINNKMADNARLEKMVMIEAERLPIEAQAAATAKQAATPAVVVVPQATAPQAPIVVAPQVAPAAGPTIINAPNPAPQTSVIQPVQTVPVPLL